MGRGKRGRLSTPEPPATGWNSVFRTLALLLGLAIGLGALAWPSLVAPWFARGAKATARVHDLAYGSLAGVLIAVPLVSQARDAARRVAAMQEAALAAVAWVIGGVVSGAADLTIAGVAALVLVVASMHPSRRSVFRPRARASASILAVAIAGAVPLIAVSVHAASVQRRLGSVATGNDWTIVAGLALAVAAVALLTSFRTPGWRLALWTSAASAAVYGAASLASPRASGAASGRAAWAILAWALAFVAVGETVARTPAPEDAGAT